MADEVGFSVGAVARRLGVAPSTLRTWNRRYGIGAQELSPGRHRRYTAEDITRLEHMQRLILRGAAPADAAQVALTSAGTAGARPGRGCPGGPDAGPVTAPAGQRLALPGASPAARGLARAALAMDDALMDEIIRAGAGPGRGDPHLARPCSSRCCPGSAPATSRPAAASRPSTCCPR